jgi:hypothetical protein
LKRGKYIDNFRAKKAAEVSALKLHQVGGTSFIIAIQIMIWENLDRPIKRNAGEKHHCPTAGKLKDFETHLRIVY